MSDTPTTQPPANTRNEPRVNMRFSCDGEVEINRIPSTGPRKAKLRDVSAAGCFVETNQPFATPSYVEMVVCLEKLTLRITGTVRHTQAFGMGIEFDRLSRSGRLDLEELILELKQTELKKQASSADVSQTNGPDAKGKKTSTTDSHR